jgi:hypothetical protein
MVSICSKNVLKYVMPVHRNARNIQIWNIAGHAPKLVVIVLKNAVQRLNGLARCIPVKGYFSGLEIFESDNRLSH